MERDSQHSTNNWSSLQDGNTIYLDVVCSINKKGRVYGLGSGTSAYFPSSSNSNVTASQYEVFTGKVATLIY